ncbi:MAG: fumarylacetoacetate hydrolase family protein [Rhodospirillales bacterium]
MIDAAKAAEILIEAHLGKKLLDDIPDDCKPATFDDALAVQNVMLKHPAITYAGWKVARTNAQLQKDAGLSEPAYGPIFAEFNYEDGHRFEAGAPSVRAIECEFAVVLAKDLPASGAPYSMEQAADAVATMHPAIEVTGQRFRTRDALGRPASTMDFAGNFAFVFGSGVADWRKFDLPNHGVEHIINGDVICTSTGANVLGNPLNSISWLANKLATRGLEMKAGDWISTGAATGPIPVAAGAEVIADFGDLGRARCTLPAE